MGDQLIGTDVTALLQAKKQSKLFSRTSSTEKASVGLFVAQLVGWMLSKFLGIFSGILSALLSIEKSLINLRIDTLQLFYWGRGNVFALFLQAIAVFVVLAVGFTFVVSRGIQNRILSQYSVSEPQVVYASDADTVVESGSLITSMPKELKRIETIDYIVSYDDTIGGNTLSNIASDFEITSDSIRWANNFSKTYQPKPGTKIKIPPVSGSQYTVQSGDTLDSIASRFKMDKLTIVEVNYLDGSNAKLRTGQQLFLAGVAPQLAVKKKSAGSKSYLLYGMGNGGSFSVPKGPKFLIWPTTVSTVSRCFLGGGYIHDGFDIYSASGNPSIYAAAAGKVTYAGIHCTVGMRGYPCGGYAWVVEIDHGNGFTTMYGHLYPNSLKVGVGDVVSRGQTIARMGSTGTSTGTHLHFQVNHGGYLGRSSLLAVNPAPYMYDSKSCR